MGLLMVIPVWHVTALWNGKYPFSRMVSLIKTEEFKIQFLDQLQEWISQGEKTISRFMQDNPRALWFAFGLSLFAWIGVGLEYILLFSMVDAVLTWQGVGIGLIASRLAFLTPFPEAWSIGSQSGFNNEIYWY
jgi:hypothetical protein